MCGVEHEHRSRRRVMVVYDNQQVTVVATVARRYELRLLPFALSPLLLIRLIASCRFRRKLRQSEQDQTETEAKREQHTEARTVFPNPRVNHKSNFHRVQGLQGVTVVHSTRGNRTTVKNI